MAVGTHSGKLYLLDLMGNELKSINCHTTTINALSMDLSEQFIASASDDGSIKVHGIYTSFKQSKNYMRPMKAVALSPDFGTNSQQRIISGGLAGQLIMNTKGWLGYTDQILQSDDGPILEIQWKGNYIAWASDSGVKIYNSQTNQRISFIPRSESSPRADLYPCHLYWKSNIELFIGWADTFKIAKVHDPSIHPAILSQLPSVEIEYILRTDFIISGISYLKEQILLLAYNGEIIYEDKDFNKPSKPSNPPELRIVDKKDGADVADILTMNGYLKFKSQDYKLVTTPSSDLYFIMSPKDLICAKERELTDRIEWHIENELYYEALQLIKQHPEESSKYTINKVGKLYMKHLILQQDYERAGKLCVEVLGKDQQQWEKWIFAFYQSNQINAIIEFIPTREVILSSTVYEMLLAHYLKWDKNLFFKLIRQWPIKNYNLKSILALVEDELNKYDIENENENENQNESKLLLQIIAELYQLDNQPQLALNYLLKLKSPIVFNLINEFQLFNEIKNKVKLLMDYDVLQFQNELEYQKAGVQVTSELKAVTMLVRNLQFISMETVVNQLYDHPLLLHNYLHAIFKKEANLGAKWHDIQVELYAEFDYPLLMGFLRSSNDYSLKKAYNCCELRELVPELIYILSRMGEYQKALLLILQKLGDIDKAIDYVKEYEDEELWQVLLKHSQDKPEFLKALLEQSGSHIEPNKVIQSIPKGLKIPGLKKSILKILMDFQLQMSLRIGCEKVISRDSKMLSKQWKQKQKRGMTVFGDNEEFMNCSKCEKSVMDNGEKEELVFFYCGHGYHVGCLGTKIEINGRSKYEVKLQLNDLINCPRCDQLPSTPKLEEENKNLLSKKSNLSLNEQLPPMVNFIP
ncbi:hypothetical protein K502DRAFT_316454 [Neoconidiobolus thromboides FSU 785]|nr:hypothetical protein K502DRAFT_316454 [Neoconidiobolus thromboides FSU 785]